MSTELKHLPNTSNMLRYLSIDVCCTLIMDYLNHSPLRLFGVTSNTVLIINYAL